MGKKRLKSCKENMKRFGENEVDEFLGELAKVRPRGKAIFLKQDAIYEVNFDFKPPITKKIEWKEIENGE